MVRFIFLVLSVFLISACQRAETSKDPAVPKFDYVTNGVASFWTIAEAGAKAAGRDLGVAVSVHMPAQGIGDQKRIVEDVLTRGTDGMALSLIDPVNQTELVNMAARNAIVITHDSDAPESNRIVYVGMDNYLAGRMVGEMIKAGMPEGGTLGIFIGRLEQDNARRRRQGMIDELLDRSNDSSRYDPPGAELKNDTFTILGTLTDQFDRAKAKANVEDLIARHPDIEAMVGLFAYNTPIILEVLKQAGKKEQVKVFSFDEAEETLKAIKDGGCVGTVVQDPYEYGYRSIQVLYDLHLKKQGVVPESKFINIPARKITSETVVAFWDDLKEKLARGVDESKIAPS
jgi:ribose transport system substrate-binding protein